MFLKDYCKAIYDIAEKVPIKQLRKTVDEIAIHIQNGGNKNDNFCRDKYLFLLNSIKSVDF